MLKLIKDLCDPSSNISAPMAAGILLIIVAILMLGTSFLVTWPLQAWEFLKIVIPLCFFGGAGETYTQKRWGNK